MKNKGRKHLSTDSNQKGYLTGITRPITSMSSKGVISGSSGSKWAKKKWMKRIRGYFKTNVFKTIQEEGDYINE